ncbi:MAG TPA: hypothetical protein VMB21_13105 [Candidatus Limnocylindria bacterium]|jgi:hypothetical protein|nr:hypothetical protein [Candidatus Limnocylindria bacterium]
MNSKGQNRSTSGFTRPELLAVIMALGLLVLLITAATRPVQAKTAVCLANLRGLAHGMSLYAEDNRGWLPGNNGGSAKDWVPVSVDYGSPSFTNSAILQDPNKSKLTRYLSGVPAVYRCPADRLTQRGTRDPALQARSYSLNGAVGTNPEKSGTVAVDGPWLNGSFGHTVGQAWLTYGRYADMVAPAPSQLFTFIDEHPYSINDSTFAVSAQTPQWIDWPAVHHDSGGAFAFADGHSERHRWQDQRTLLTGPLALNVPSHGNLDLVWIQQRTSTRIPK